METITTIIATTLPDTKNEKFTKQLLHDLKKQINNADPSYPVKDMKGVEIGKVERSKIDLANRLEVTINIDTSTIDKGHEYFFVPVITPFEIIKEGKFLTLKQGTLNGIRMVKMPFDLSLVPVRFAQEFKEGIDYHVKNHEDLTPEVIDNLIYDAIPVYVYYPVSFGAENVIQDALKKKLIISKGNDTGSFMAPFEIKAVPGTFEEFKIAIKELWKKHAMAQSGN